MDSKYGEFGRDRALKAKINSKFDNKSLGINKNIERLAAPLLSPKSFLSKYKKFEGVDMNKHMKAVIENYRRGGFEPKPKESSLEKVQVNSG